MRVEPMARAAGVRRESRARTALLGVAWNNLAQQQRGKAYRFARLLLSRRNLRAAVGVKPIVSHWRDPS